MISDNGEKMEFTKPKSATGIAIIKKVLKLICCLVILPSILQFGFFSGGKSSRSSVNAEAESHDAEECSRRDAADKHNRTTLKNTEVLQKVGNFQFPEYLCCNEQPISPLHFRMKLEKVLAPEIAKAESQPVLTFEKRNESHCDRRV